MRAMWLRKAAGGMVLGFSGSGVKFGEEAEHRTLNGGRSKALLLRRIEFEIC